VTRSTPVVAHAVAVTGSGLDAVEVALRKNAGVDRAFAPAAGCRAPAAEQAGRVLAKVGDRTITLGDYVAALEHMDQFDRMRYQSPERRKELLNEMIDLELLANEARQKGYDQDPVAQQEIRAILRDFDEDRLQEHLALLNRVAEEVLSSAPRAHLSIDTQRQYRNMRAYLEPVPEVTRAAEAAIRAEGMEPVRTFIRGGTDGSLLSEMGLPTPNLFTGGHEYHSVREWASVNDMAAAAATIVRLAEVWTQAVG